MAPKQRELVACQHADIHAAKKILAVGRRIETAENIHAGGFARAGWAHHGDELAIADGEIDAAQGRHRRIAHAVDLADIAKGDERCLCRAGAAQVATIRPARAAPAWRSS